MSWRHVTTAAFVFGMPWAIGIARAVGFNLPGAVIVVGLWALLVSISVAPWSALRLLLDGERLGDRFALVLGLGAAYALSTAGAYFVAAHYSG